MKEVETMGSFLRYYSGHVFY